MEASLQPSSPTPTRCSAEKVYNYELQDPRQLLYLVYTVWEALKHVSPTALKRAKDLPDK